MSQEFKAPEEDDVQMPLGTGADTAPAEDYAEPPKMRVNTSTLALVAAFAAALVVLYFLGLQNKPRQASAEEAVRNAEIDSKINDILNSKRGAVALNGVTSESERLSAILNAYFGAKRVAEDLPADPFRGPEAPVKMVDAGPVVIPQRPSDPVDPQLVEAAKVFSGLKLQMIMLGQPSSALINNQIANVGTRFDPLVVTDIKADRVILGYKERSFELKTGAPAGHN